MKWKNLKNNKIRRSNENLLHNNIFEAKDGKSMEVLADAMDDDASKVPDNVDSPPSSNEDDEQNDFSALEEEGEDGAGSNENETEGSDSFGESEDSSSDSSDDSFGSSGDEENKPKEIKNNPLSNYHGNLKIIKSFTELSTRVENIKNTINSSEIKVSKKNIGKLDELIDIIDKDKKSAALSTVHENILRLELDKKILKELLIKIVNEAQQEAKGNKNDKKEKE